MKSTVIPVLLLSIGLSFFAGAEKQLSKKEYVDLWKNTAVRQMSQFKIPASITLAQGILESGSGNSELARKGNNHFGIKCHDWQGKTMYIDDDRKGECFRVYESPEESYADHSEFLTSKKRYSNLFNLPLTDYKAWARGLKEAGYATNPKYPELLIGIIEDMKLYELDGLNGPVQEKAPEVLAQNNKTEILQAQNHAPQYNTNKVKYVVAQKGDTYFRIAQEFGLSLNQLYRYNDFDSKKDLLSEGDIIYVHPKKHNSKVKSVQLKKDMTIKEISQQEGISLKKLMKKNDIASKDEQLSKGQKVFLR